MKELFNHTEQNFQLPYEYVGEVLDTKDPEYRGRLKCKIFGITETSTDYPWCEIRGDFFGADKSTVGMSSVPKVASLVYISFLYGNPSFPLVTGYVRGNKDSSNLHKVANLGESVYNTRNSRLIGPELEPLNTSSEYTKNNVIETDSSVIEIDDTGGNERISIQHKNGSYYELRPNGTIQIKSVKDTYHIITGNLEEYVQQCVHSVIKGNHSQSVTGSYTEDIGKNMSTTISGDLAQLISGTFSITASGNLTINNDVKINGSLQVSADTTVDGNITSKSQMADIGGKLSSLRETFEIHTHTQNAGDDYGAGGITSDPIETVSTERPADFTQTSTSAGLSASECGSTDVFMEPARVDSSESYYTENIKPKLTSDEVPEGYPTNAEQVEETKEQVQDGVVGTQKNPFEIAEQLLNLGRNAWQETGKNPNIKALWDEIGYDGNRFADQTAWCAVFVSAVLKRSGNKYIKTASSQAYANYGIEVKDIRDAKVGDIVVFYRKGKNSNFGHVGFYCNKYNDTRITVLGGNQSDNLTIASFKRLDESKGWGIRTIRRAVSAEDGTSVPPDYAYSVPSNIYTGGKVV
jgi:uncharacterized protein (TIGR02594 family)